MKERLLLKRQIYTTVETAPEKTMGRFLHMALMPGTPRNLCENFKVNEQKLILIFGQNSPSFIYLNHGIFSNFTTC